MATKSVIVIDQDHIGFASKGRNKIHYFFSTDVYFPETFCERDIRSVDFVNNYDRVVVNKKNIKNVCDTCLEEFKRQLTRSKKLKLVRGTL